MDVVHGSTDLGLRRQVARSVDGVYGSPRDGGATAVSTAGGDPVSVTVLGPLYGVAHGDTSSSPADVVLQAYLARGTEAFSGLHGHFVAVVVDAAQDHVVIAVSPECPHRVYWSSTGDALTWSTSLLPIAQGLNAAPDRSYEDFLLLYGFLPHNRTFFEDVRVLPDGQLLMWSDAQVTTQPIAESDPWGSTYTDKLAGISEGDAVDVLYEGFLRALEEQLPVSDRVGVLLGGFDSALVVAGLRQLGRAVDTYTFRYGDPAYDQPHTDTVARAVGSTHHWVSITPDQIGDGIRDYAKYFSSVTNWPNYVIQTRIVLERMAADGLDVAFSGDGCDQLFFGYPLTFRRSQVVNAMPTIPSPVHRGILRALSRPSIDRAMGRPYTVGMGVLRQWGRPRGVRSHLSFRIFDEVSLSNLRRDSPPQAEDVESILDELAAPFVGMNDVRAAYLGKKFVSPNRIKIAGSTESTGLPVFSPFLHRGLKNVALNLPPELLRPEQATSAQVIGKYALAKMAVAHRLLPEEVVYQPKLGAADAPVADWYAGPLRATLWWAFDGLPFEANTAYLDRLMRMNVVERAYARVISRDTSDVVSMSHGASLLATYGATMRAHAGDGERVASWMSGSPA